MSVLQHGSCYILTGPELFELLLTSHTPVTWPESLLYAIRCCGRSLTTEETRSAVTALPHCTRCRRQAAVSSSVGPSCALVRTSCTELSFRLLLVVRSGTGCRAHAYVCMLLPCGCARQQPHWASAPSSYVQYCSPAQHMHTHDLPTRCAWGRACLQRSPCDLNVHWGLHEDCTWSMRPKKLSLAACSPARLMSISSSMACTAARRRLTCASSWLPLHTRLSRLVVEH